MEVWNYQLYNLGENIILVLTFSGHVQFSPYILIAVNLVLVIFNLQLI